MAAADIRKKILVWLGEDSTQGKTTQLVRLIGGLIIFSIVLAVLATEPVVREKHIQLLLRLDVIVAVLFLIEYLARLWIAPLRPGSRKGLRGSLDYALTPLAVLDLIAIAPTILGFITPELYLLRVIRLVRIARLGRSKRFKKSTRHLRHAIQSKKDELGIAAAYTGLVIFISSVLMYVAEGQVQVQEFGSIPRCLWWSVITVTTVGYGDVSPVTAIGKVIASITALAGVTIIAIPIGIISAGFTESVATERASRLEETSKSKKKKA